MTNAGSTALRMIRGRLVMGYTVNDWDFISLQLRQLTLACHVIVLPRLGHM